MALAACRLFSLSFPQGAVELAIAFFDAEATSREAGGQRDDDTNTRSAAAAAAALDDENVPTAPGNPATKDGTRSTSGTRTTR